MHEREDLRSFVIVDVIIYLTESFVDANLSFVHVIEDVAVEVCRLLADEVHGDVPIPDLAVEDDLDLVLRADIKPPVMFFSGRLHLRLVVSGQDPDLS